MSKKRKASNIIKADKRQYLRDKVVSGAQIYKKHFMNKKFLIICENNESYEIVFKKKDFKHLTGIESDLNEERFFENSAASTLSENNILENQHYNYQTLKFKADKIGTIDSLLYTNTKDSLFMIDLHTNTCDFPVAIKNVNSNTCIGFFGNDNHARSLRKYSNSQDCKSQKKIKAIFSKVNGSKEYSESIYISGDISDLFEKDSKYSFSEKVKERLGKSTLLTSVK